MTNPSLPTGRTIVLELVKEMEERLYPLMYRTVPPSVYHVYLHPEDYRAVEAVVSLLVVDAQRGLNARVDELNRRSRLLVFVTGKQPPIEVPAGGWEIHIQQEPNGEVVRGDFRIESRLSLPATPTYNDGVPTTRIGRTTVSGGSRRTVVTEQAATTLGTTPGATLPTTPTAATSNRPPDEPGGGFARLAYVDEQGPHIFVIRKDLVAIGRGGSAHWVDVQVVSTPRVSRVHCRIRRHPDGRFLLQDVSTWGTSIDGERLPPLVRSTIGENAAAQNAAGRGDGQLEETGVERELPAQARIQLADAVTIEFQALPVR